jgi:hypothetical protein
MKTFDFTRLEGPTAYLVWTHHLGKIEVLKNREDARHCHIAIRVSNFEEACKRLREKGIGLEEPYIIKRGLKVAFLNKLDPAGNRVHIIYARGLPFSID